MYPYEVSENDCRSVCAKDSCVVLVWFVRWNDAARREMNWKRMRQVQVVEGSESAACFGLREDWRETACGSALVHFGSAASCLETVSRESFYVGHARHTRLFPLDFLIRRWVYVRCEWVITWLDSARHHWGVVPPPSEDLLTGEPLWRADVHPRVKVLLSDSKRSKGERILSNVLSVNRSARMR